MRDNNLQVFENITQSINFKKLKSWEKDSNIHKLYFRFKFR